MLRTKKQTDSKTLPTPTDRVGNRRDNNVSHFLMVGNRIEANNYTLYVMFRDIAVTELISNSKQIQESTMLFGRPHMTSY